MADKASNSQATINSAVPMLGGGAVLTALSTTTFDGTVATVMAVAGAIVIVCGAIVLGKGLQQKKLEEAQE